MDTKNNSKTKLIVLVASLIVLTTSLTYAFFAGGAGPDANTDVDITSGVTTKLLFTEGTPINLELNETTVAEGGGNVSGTTTSTATLNLGTNVASATENYFVYFDISANNFVYTTAAKTPEILLSITDPDGTAVTLSGLTEVSLGVYDITEYKGLITVASNYEISGSTDTTQEWEAEITFVNLSTNQAANEGKSLVSEFILQENKILPVGTEYILSQNGGISSIEAKPTPDFTQVADTNEGLFATTDEYGTSYYYRGTVNNNWLYFNGIYWRIVRITGDGAYRLIYSGISAPTEATSTVMTGDSTQIGKAPYNGAYNDNAYVGYMYTMAERHGLNNDSSIKTTLENWYNFNMASVDSQISDNIFCYDRSLAITGYQSADFGWNGTTYTGTGINKSATLYGATGRITASSEILESGGSGPSLVCSERLDSYTKDDAANGNGKLSEKIGLLTLDEVIMAGITFNHIESKNQNNYLFTYSYYWLGSPYGFNSRTTSAHVWSLSSSGEIDASYTTSSRGVRPVIHLSGDVTLSGTGVWNDPYIVS